MPLPVPTMRGRPLDYYLITYSAQQHLLRGTSLRPLSPEEMTEACEVLLATAQSYQCPYWLLDGRPNPRGQPLPLRQWLREEFFPRVHSTLGQRLYVAFLVRPAFRLELDEKGFGIDEPLHPFAGRIGWFVDEAEILDWLARYRG